MSANPNCQPKVNSAQLRHRLEALVSQYDLPASALPRFERLLVALAAEADPQTTISEPTPAVDWHVADSLVALEVPALREANAIVDIGSGPGFPGLPLALALPEAQLDLVEASRRKAALIERLAASAGIVNARAVHLRVEEWAASGSGAASYDVATARAVGPLVVLVEYAAPLLRVGGMFVAWKGRRNEAEEEAGRQAAKLLGLRATGVRKVRPFEGARDRHLYLYLKESPTPERYPRRPGAAAKRPLA